MSEYIPKIPAPGWNDEPRSFEYGQAWMSEKEVELFGTQALDHCTKYLEIGSWHGYSAYLASIAFCDVICIDSAKTNEFARFLKYFPKVDFIQGASHLVSDRIKNKSQDLIFFDANHTYEFLSREIRLYVPKLVECGILAFHDYNTKGECLGEWGVAQAVDELLEKGWKCIGWADSLVLLQRTTKKRIEL